MTTTDELTTEQQVRVMVQLMGLELYQPREGEKWLLAVESSVECFGPDDTDYDDKLPWRRFCYSNWERALECLPHFRPA